jgi:hypothetical protein
MIILITPRKLQCDKGTEFMGSVTLLMNKYSVEIRKIKASFSYTALPIVDRYAGLFFFRLCTTIWEYLY